MPTTSAKESHKLTLPFVCRQKETEGLKRLHAQRKHALIPGPAGIGKTALINHLRQAESYLRETHEERLACENRRSP